METVTETNIDRKIAGMEKNIPGWGIDANPDNDPTYPMKNRSGADYQRLNYARPVQQPVTKEVLHSNERPGITSVFGTSSPPGGLSGVLRRYAFKFSEGSSAHWMTLILADRVNVVEGIIDDLKHGHVPNIIKERGWNAEWKYNRKGVIKNALIGMAAVSTLIAIIAYRKKNRKVLPS